MKERMDMGYREFSGSLPDAVRVTDLAVGLQDPDPAARRQSAALAARLAALPALALVAVEADATHVTVSDQVTTGQRIQLGRLVDRVLAAPQDFLWLGGDQLAMWAPGPGVVEVMQPEYGPHPDPDRLRRAYMNRGCQIAGESEMGALDVLAWVTERMPTWASVVLDMPDRPAVVVRDGLDTGQRFAAQADAMAGLENPQRFDTWWRRRILAFDTATSKAA